MYKNNNKLQNPSPYSPIIKKKNKFHKKQKYISHYDNLLNMKTKAEEGPEAKQIVPQN